MSKSIDMVSNIATRLNNGFGSITTVLFQAGRGTVDMILRTVFPFMVFISVLVGIISASGIGGIIAHFPMPLADTLPGPFALPFICSMPFLSPILGPGAVITQVVDVFTGTEIGSGNVSPRPSPPMLFAIDSQVAADFLPVALSLTDADPETIEIGVPPVLMARVVIGPLGAFIGYSLSTGLYWKDCSI